MLTDYFRELDSDGTTISTDYVYQRAGGGYGFAGDWQSIKETMISPFLMLVKEFQGDGLSFIFPSEHKTKNVKFDGKDYPNGGRNAARGASPSIRRLDERTLVITDKVAGNVSDTEEIGLSADLKTLTITGRFPGRSRLYWCSSGNSRTKCWTGRLSSCVGKHAEPPACCAATRQTALSQPGGFKRIIPPSPFFRQR